MNWYKKAKLIDKKAPTDINSIHLTCQYCGRWATHSYNVQANKDEYVWKRPEQLDLEEKRQMNKSYSLMGISHGICPYCMEILERSAENIFNMSPQEIRNESLAKRDVVPV